MLVGRRIKGAQSFYATVYFGLAKKAHADFGVRKHGFDVQEKGAAKDKASSSSSLNIISSIEAEELRRKLMASKRLEEKVAFEAIHLVTLVDPCFIAYDRTTLRNYVSVDLVLFYLSILHGNTNPNFSSLEDGLSAQKEGYLQYGAYSCFVVIAGLG